MKVVKTILCVLFGLMFINAGLDKFLHYMPMPEMSSEMMEIYDAFQTLVWLMPFVGFIELVGGLLFIIPKSRALGAIVILPITVGIIIHNAVFMPEGLTIAGPFFLVNIWIIVENWGKYKPIFQ